MELTVKELSYLSKVIEVEEYPYVTQLLPLLDNEEKKLVRRQLDQKKLLEEGEITELGLRVCHILETTSKEDQYLKWNHLWMYEYRGSYIVLYAKDKETLVVEQLSKEELLIVMLGRLQKLGSIEEKKLQVQHMPRRRFKGFMEEHPEIEAYFYELVNEGKRDVGSLHVYNGYLQHYQMKQQKLYSLPRSKMYGVVEELVTGGIVDVIH